MVGLKVNISLPDNPIVRPDLYLSFFFSASFLKNKRGDKLQKDELFYKHNEISASQGMANAKPKFFVI